MKLNEILRESNDHTMSDDEIIQWLTDRDDILQPYDIEIQNGIVNVRGGVRLTAALGDMTELPFKFGYITEDLEIGQNHLTTLKGFPDLVGGDLVLTDLPITGFDHIPKKIGSGLYFAGTQITSLVGIQNHIKNIGHNRRKYDGEILTRWDAIREGGLGLVLIESAYQIIMPGGVTAQLDMPRPFEIINKYLGKPDDVFECQAELIEEGFEAYAKL